MNRYATHPPVWLALFSVLLVVGGCDNLSSYNTNPNEPTEADPNNILANAQRDLANAVYDDNTMMRGSNVWAQYTTQNFYPSESRYASVNYGWNAIYAPLNDLKTAKKFARQGLVTNQNNVEAVATIMQVWAYHILSDAYGSVPMQDALGGVENPSPAYTSQSEMYPALLDSLDKALGLINNKPGPSGDLVHGGDMTKWARFGNGLKMRIAIRMSDVNTSMAKTAIQEANGKALQSNADNTYFQFGTTETHRTDYYNNRVNLFRDDFDGSDRFINAMKQYETKDPRLDAYFEQTSNTNRPCEDGSGEYKGFPYGMEQGSAQNTYSANPTCAFSRPEDWWARGPSGDGDAYAPMMYYDEVLLTKAEAAARGWISGNPQALIAQAIEASVNFYGSETDANISGSSTQTQNYIDAVQADYSENGFEQVIGEQRWIAFYMNNIQGWATWRRLDFEGWIGAPNGGVAGGFDTYAPLRVDYPDTEYTLNGQHVEAAAEEQFGSVESESEGVRIWWDTDAPPADPY